MAWENEDLPKALKDKIKDFVWSNLSSRRIVAQTTDLYTSKILEVIIAMLGGKMEEDNPTDTPEENELT